MDQVNKLYADAGLTAADIKMMPAYLDGTAEFYGSQAFDKLYEHLAFETGEMPYEAAKARTVTPDEWILDYITDMEA